jgi:hypothetical protein
MADASTTSTHTNIYQIDPLSNTKNQAIWKIKMMDILMGQLLNHQNQHQRWLGQKRIGWHINDLITGGR